jgi:hypothetical protein
VRYGRAELAGIIVEGAVDRFCGRPFDANPYSEDYAEAAWGAWRFGWHEADCLLDWRAQAEAQRWLREPA